MLIALVLIAIGLIFLLRNLGVVTAESWALIWPVVLILLGVYLIWKGYEWKKWKQRIWGKWLE